MKREHMKIVAFVPAKGSSERISNKNMRVLDGEYLFKRKLRQALECKLISDVYLDTESDELASHAADLPIKRLSRPAALATNATDGHEMFAYECSQVPDADIYIQILCTAPFVTADTLTRAIERLLATPDADSLVAVQRTKQYGWDGSEPLYGRGRVPNSVDLPETVIEAMSLYMVRRDPSGAAPTKRFGHRPILFDLDPQEQVDVNLPADLAFAETICAGQRAIANNHLRAMRSHLSSPVLADICKEMGLKAVLPSKIRRMTGGKVLGRAKTLELAALPVGASRKSDEWKGIYGALDSYQFVRPGDVIVVSTDVPHHAYFGDLNANIAVRAGAVGAIIDGFTRDTADVRALDFPVYAHASYCDDIKYEGTLASMNRPIVIGGIEIGNGDYVFADCDGVVVVPQQMWAEVEERAWNVLTNEARIRMYAARGRDVGEILAECGAF